MTQPAVPDSESAARAASAVMGWADPEVRRFSTGAAHFVFEARVAGQSPVVVRMGRQDQRDEMMQGLRLMRHLAKLGVPLPAILAEGLAEPFPFVVMQRFAGTDLGDVIRVLPEQKLRAVAQRVAEAQQATLGFGSAGRYGYAASAEAAPHETWSAVVEQSIERSRRRLVAAGLFEASIADALTDRFLAIRQDLDEQPTLPFLHDTTVRNVIVTEDGVMSGIVDVDDLCFGDPRYAPALTLAAIMAHGGPVSYVDWWMRHAGYRDDRMFRFYVAVFLLDLLSEHGQRFNGNERPSTPEGRDRVLRAFTEALTRASAP